MSHYSTVLRKFKITPILFGSLALAGFSSGGIAGPPVISGPNEPQLDFCTLNPGTASCACILNPSLCDTEEEVLPDLKIVNIVYEEHDCLLEVVIKNIGRATVSSSFDVDVFFGHITAPEIGDLSVHFETYSVTPSSEIAPGDMVRVRMEIPLGISGPTNVSALVDSTRVIEESNEGNNHWFNCSTLNLSCLI